MKEIELKILEIDVKKMCLKLRKLGAKQIHCELFIAESFDFPDRSLHQHDSYLRIRNEGKRTVLTFKGKSQDTKYFKQRPEIECAISDFKTMKKILQKLGMQLGKHHEKRRTSFVLGKAHFDIDEYPSIPPYMEIEGSQKEISLMLKKLGYALDQTTKMTASQVLRWYGKNADSQRFPKITAQ